MRIISKSKDVYDLQHSMFDADRSWRRSPEEVEISLPKIDVPLYYLNRTARTVSSIKRESSFLPLFFCGEIYWLHRVIEDGVISTNTLVWEDMYLADIFRTYTLTSIKNELTPMLQRELRKLNKPIVLVEEFGKKEVDGTFYAKAVTNPTLWQESIPWQGIDSNLYRLHQTIESYIFGVIGQENPELVKLSNRDLLESKGFDYITSFRGK